jgi:NTP pyrophosphatase (non-canonical NTP hydrolase)
MDKKEFKLTLHPAVARQAIRMQQKLDERLARYPSDGERDNWLRCRLDHLMAHLQREVAEFVKAVNDSVFEGEVSLDEADDHLQKEGGDVANLVMMVQDKVMDMHANGFRRLRLALPGDKEYIKG